MKLQKHIKAVLASAIIAVMLSGCFPTGEVSAPESAPSNVEGLTISASCPEKTPGSVPEITVIQREWDKDKLINVFFGGNTITYENSFESVREVMHYVYKTGDGRFLGFENGKLEYEAQYGDSRSLLYGLYSTSYMYDLFPDETIAGFSREEALERVYEIINKAEIKNLGEPEVYAITAERANNFAYDDIKWTKDDEVYYIRFPVVYNDIPLFNRTTSVTIPGSYFYFEGSYLATAISRSELVYLKGVNILDEAHKTGEDIQIKFSAANALDQTKIYFSEREHEPLTVIGCELTYIPSAENGILNISFKPAWRVECIVEDLNLRRTKSIVYDAATGAASVNYAR